LSRADFHDEPPIRNLRTKPVVPCMFHDSESVGSQENIVLGTKLVWSFPESGYPKLTACGKLPKSGTWISSETLRCCRDLFRPWTKNSSNSMEP
jgi:hypothetical protein